MRLDGVDVFSFGLNGGDSRFDLQYLLLLPPEPPPFLPPSSSSPSAPGSSCPSPSSARPQSEVRRHCSTLLKLPTRPLACSALQASPPVSKLFPQDPQLS